MPTVYQTEDNDVPASWEWQEDEVLAGRHVEFCRANSPGSGDVIWVLVLDDGQRVSVWVEPSILKAKLADELRRRQIDGGTPTLRNGERVRVNPGSKRISKRGSGQTVWPFPLVWFEHGVPDASAEELLLGDCDGGP